MAYYTYNWSCPSDLSAQEQLDFREMVLKGREVAAAGLSELVTQAQGLIRVYRDGQLVAVAGLKNPRPARWQRTFDKAAVSSRAGDYPYEFGWAYVDPSARRQGVARSMIPLAVQGAGGRGIYATCRAENDAMLPVLGQAGFVPLGSNYASDDSSYMLILLVFGTSRFARGAVGALT